MHEYFQLYLHNLIDDFKNTQTPVTEESVPSLDFQERFSLGHVSVLDSYFENRSLIPSGGGGSSAFVFCLLSRVDMGVG